MSSLMAPGGGKELADCFLDGLRRDAFLMEWGAYRVPVLPAEAEFRAVFASFWERVNRVLQLQQPPSLVCIVQVQHPDSSYESLICAQSSLLGREQVCHRWKPSQRLPMESIQRPFDFAKELLLQQQRAIPETFRLFSNDSTFNEAVARYYVRPVLEDRPRANSMNLQELITFEPIARKTGFVQTESFMVSIAPTSDVSSDAYYSSVLGLAVPAHCMFSDEQLRWLEVMHVSLQLSWGFPLLMQKREELVRQQEQSSHLEEVRVVARSLSETIERHVIRHAHKLLNLVDPATIFDNHLVSRMFNQLDARNSKVLWQGSAPEDRVVAKHAIGEAEEELESARKFVALAVHRILGTPNLQNVSTSDALVAEASRVLQSAKYEPGLMKLLSAALTHPLEGFNLLKHVWFAPQETAREVSLYAIAMRLALGGGNNNVEFRVTVVDEFDNELSLTRSDLGHEQLFELGAAQWYKRPLVKAMGGVAACEWVRPFASLVTNGLQRISVDDGVFVSSVRLQAAKSATEITCFITEEIPAKFQHVAALYEGIMDLSAEECSSHNLRGSIREFRECMARPSLASRIQATLAHNPKALTLTVR